MDINAEKIKQLRLDKSWTQQHLADACGLSMRTIQRVERYGNASKETLMALASVFETSQHDLLSLPVEVKVVEAPVVDEGNRDKRLIITSGVIGVLIGVTATLTVNLLI